MKHLLISPILCEESALINLGFLIKEDLIGGFNLVEFIF